MQNNNLANICKKLALLSQKLAIMDTIKCFETRMNTRFEELFSTDLKEKRERTGQCHSAKTHSPESGVGKIVGNLTKAGPRGP